MKFSALPVWVMLISLFPYLPAGLRVENIIFPFFVAGYILSLRFNFKLGMIYLIQIFSLLIPLFGVLLASYVSFNTGVAADPFVMFVRLSMPLLMLISFSAIVNKISNPLISVAFAIMVCAVPVSLVSLLSVFFDIAEFLQYWIKNDPDGVWAQSLAIGRFNGIFNQPLESGIFFSVALFSSIYLLKVLPRIRVLSLFCIVFVILGGLLSFSKNFTVLGLIFGLYLLVALRMVSFQVAAFAFIFLCISVFSLVAVFNNNYADSLVDLFEQGGFLLALTAGRLGAEDTGVSLLFSELFHQGYWFIGRGLGSHMPLDNGYLEYFYQGGVLALVGYLCFIVTLFGYRGNVISNHHKSLLNTLAFFVIFASLGGPVITASRANLPLIFLIVACVAKSQAYSNFHCRKLIKGN